MLRLLLVSRNSGYSIDIYFAKMKEATLIACVLLFCQIVPCKTQSLSCFTSMCEFTLIITESRAMTFTTEDGLAAYDVELEENGTLKLVPNLFHSQVPNVSLTPEMVHTVDGSSQRKMILINGQFPGPTIEVVEGAEVAIKVINKMQKEGIAVHWHGIHMRDNVWMDGVPYVTQCPIIPRESFTYRFIADPPGTHWYHSHNDLQRVDGLYGALIVHRSKERGAIPHFSLVLSDWFPIPSTEIQILDPFVPPFGTAKTVFLPVDKKGASFDGVKISSMDFWSGLINGRGRKGNNSAPLTVVSAVKEKRHRVHIVLASGEFAYRVSIDNHELTVIESDGNPVKPMLFESVILFPGETCTVEFEANQNLGRYWIRATTLRMGYGYKNPQPDDIVWDAKAILHYEGASNMTGDPTSTRQNCTSKAPCKILNCAWPAYRQDLYPNMECVALADLRLDNSRYHGHEGNISLEDETVDLELFLNLAFPVPTPGTSINSRMMAMPSAPLYQHPSTWGLVPCTSECDTKGCRCSNIINIPANKTVQLVMMSDIFGGHQEGTDFGSINKAHHPMHLHGYNFRVLKMGFPVVNKTNGKILRGNEDIGCKWRQDRICNRPFWTAGSATGLNFDNPPLKDTVVVPAMGYTVVRFRTNNPGYWLLHCHIMLHHFEGMLVIFNVSSYEDHPPVPRGFRTCESFDIGHEEFRRNLAESGKKRQESERCEKTDAGDGMQEETSEKIPTIHTMSAIAASCSCVAVLLHLVLLVLFCKLFKASRQTHPAGDENKMEMVPSSKM